MSDIGSKTVCIYDLSGTYTHIAESLVDQFGRVLYHSQWQTGFSDVKDYLPGLGLEGVEHVADFFDIIDQCDLFVFPDVGMDGLQEFLRRSGFPVWGSAGAGALERDRVLLKRVLTECGMDVADYVTIQGVDSLRKLLMKREDLYVKISYFRGVAETYHHMNKFASMTWLDDLSARLGPFGQVMDFLIEEPIEGDAVEVGMDGFAVNGKYPENSLWGYECKDAAYLGSTAGVPERLRNVSDLFKPALQAYDYCGPLTNEVRVTKDKDFLVDITCRYPSPPSEIQTKLISNFAEIVWHGAHGVLVEPEYDYPYVAQLVLKSDWTTEHAIGLRIGIPERVVLHGHARINDEDYAVCPAGLAEFGAAVGFGRTLEAAITEAIEAAESVEGFQVSFDVSAFDKCMKCIREGEDFGLSWRGGVGKPISRAA